MQTASDKHRGGALASVESAYASISRAQSGRAAATGEPETISPKEQGASAPTAEITTFMDVIERAACDPNVDADKLARLLAMLERANLRSAETEFATAMNRAQAELQPVARDASNTQTKSRYASYPALDRACRAIYTKHGFALSFGTSEGAPAEHIRVTCAVSHSGGHSCDYHVDMPADGRGIRAGQVMTKTHALGAAMSYGQRYLLKLIFNIAIGDDDDGNSNGGRRTSEAFKAIVATLNGHSTAEEHALWKKTHSAAAARTLGQGEWREVIALWNRRARALSHAGDDGDRHAGDHQ